MELDALFPVIVVILVAAFGVAILLVLAWLMVRRINRDHSTADDRLL